MQLATSSGIFPRGKVTPREPPISEVGALCSCIPIPFTRALSLADWIQVVLTVGPDGKRRSVAAQVVYAGLSGEGDVGFVARSQRGIVIRGWEDHEMIAPGPCYAGMILSRGSPAAEIEKQRKIFPRAITRPITL